MVFSVTSSLPTLQPQRWDPASNWFTRLPACWLWIRSFYFYFTAQSRHTGVEINVAKLIKLTLLPFLEWRWEEHQWLTTYSDVNLGFFQSFCLESFESIGTYDIDQFWFSFTLLKKSHFSLVFSNIFLSCFCHFWPFWGYSCHHFWCVQLPWLQVSFSSMAMCL